MPKDRSSLELISNLSLFPFTCFYRVGGSIVFGIHADHDISLFRDEKFALFSSTNHNPHVTFFMSSMREEVLEPQADWREVKACHNFGLSCTSKRLPYSYIEQFSPYLDEITSRIDGSSYLLDEFYFLSVFLSERWVFLSYRPSIIDQDTLKFLTFTGLRLFLNQFGAVLLHSSSVAVKDRALVFCGPSGSGKSTVVTLLSETLQIADDSTLIMKKGNQFWAYSTPLGREGLYTITNHAPVGAIYYLEQSDRFSLRPLKASEALYRAIASERALQHPLGYPIRAYHFNFMADLFRTVPVYEMEFRKDEIDKKALLKSL
jgi:hypothetical protein